MKERNTATMLRPYLHKFSQIVAVIKNRNLSEMNNSHLLEEPAQDMKSIFK